jgi:glucan phosphoethanolaminetransferase (alkaline phosphatase superfamily)
MRPKRTAFIVSSIVIIFLPVTLFGLMASVNEYQDQGIGGAVDCDGPLTVMLFIAPSLVVYAAGAIYYAVLLKGAKQSLSAAVLMVLCVVMVFASGKKAWAAYSETIRPEHQQTCGKGW